MLQLKDINIRDPFISLIDGKYYMYGTNGMHAFGKGDVLNVYTSTDLVEWSDPHVVFKPDDNF